METPRALDASGMVYERAARIALGLGRLAIGLPVKQGTDIFRPPNRGPGAKLLRLRKATIFDTLPPRRLRHGDRPDRCEDRRQPDKAGQGKTVGLQFLERLRPIISEGDNDGPRGEFGRSMSDQSDLTRTAKLLAIAPIKQRLIRFRINLVFRETTEPPLSGGFEWSRL